MRPGEVDRQLDQPEGGRGGVSAACDAVQAVWRGDRGDGGISGEEKTGASGGT